MSTCSTFEPMLSTDESCNKTSSNKQLSSSNSYSSIRKHFAFLYKYEGSESAAFLCLCLIIVIVGFVVSFHIGRFFPVHYESMHVQVITNSTDLLCATGNETSNITNRRAIYKNKTVIKKIIPPHISSIEIIIIPRNDSKRSTHKILFTKPPPIDDFYLQKSKVPPIDDEYYYYDDDDEWSNEGSGLN